MKRGIMETVNPLAEKVIGLMLLDRLLQVEALLFCLDNVGRRH